MFVESSPGQRVGLVIVIPHCGPHSHACGHPTMNPRRFAHSSCFFLMLCALYVGQIVVVVVVVVVKKRLYCRSI